MPDSATQEPLSGKKVVVTRAPAQSEKLATALESLGAKVIAFPTIQIEPIDALFDVASLSAFDWVVFTSGNAVMCFGLVLERAGLPFDLQGVKVCAVGPATQSMLKGRGIEVDMVPEEFSGEGVLAAFEGLDLDLLGQRILVPRGELAQDLLPDGLRSLGAEVAEPIVYRTVCPEVSEEDKDALVAARPDIVTFTSASTARHYGQILGSDRLSAIPNTIYASIGPETTRAAETTGLTIAITAERHDVDGLVAAIVLIITGVREST